jgi:hypothetical protein
MKIKNDYWGMIIFTNTQLSQKITSEILLELWSDHRE